MFVHGAGVTEIDQDLGGPKRFFGIGCDFDSETALFAQVILSVDGTTLGYLGDVTKNIVAFAPSFTFANAPGTLTDTTGSIDTDQLRNLAAIIS